MPPKNDRITGEKWAECAVCGFDYPLSQLWKRRGRLVCFEVDRDEDLLSEAESKDEDIKDTVTP